MSAAITTKNPAAGIQKNADFRLDHRGPPIDGAGGTRSGKKKIKVDRPAESVKVHEAKVELRRRVPLRRGEAGQSNTHHCCKSGGAEGAGCRKKSVARHFDHPG